MSASIHPRSAGAGAVRPPSAPTTSRTTSATETQKKPGIARVRGISAPNSSQLRVIGTVSTAMKQSMPPNKLRTKSQKGDDINVNPGWTPTKPAVKGVIPPCDDTAKPAVTHIGNLVLSHDSEQPEQAGHREKVLLESNETQLARQARALAGDLDDELVSMIRSESEERGLRFMLPAQALTVVNETVSTGAQEAEDQGIHVGNSLVAFDRAETATIEEIIQDIKEIHICTVIDRVKDSEI